MNTQAEVRNRHFHEIVAEAIKKTEETKHDFQDHLKAMFSQWQSYFTFSLPLVDQTIGMEILRLLETHEQYQHTASMYDEKFIRWKFYKAVYEQACQDYPMAMKRAENRYFYV